MVGRTRVALVTCAELPDADPDDRKVLYPLTRRGIDTDIVVWDDKAVDWDKYQLVVLRSVWDYVRKRDEFVEWAQRVSRLANPADVVRWNTDKRYLLELAKKQLPVVPTTWLEPGDGIVLPSSGEFVVKPSVGAGSLDTGRYRADDEEQVLAARKQANRLLGQRRRVMVQPYLSEVDTRGENALLYFGGKFSHAVTKGAMLDGPATQIEGLYKPERITPYEATAAEKELAERVLAAVPGGPERLLYARVDVIPTKAGPVVLELELTEPSLFFGHSEGAPERFVDAVMNALELDLNKA
jgi:glutathione synthase/RimK-type ligase-like ATP-grasp enzyme